MREAAIKKMWLSSVAVPEAALKVSIDCAVQVGLIEEIVPILENIVEAPKDNDRFAAAFNRLLGLLLVASERLRQLERYGENVTKEKKRVDRWLNAFEEHLRQRGWGT